MDEKRIIRRRMMELRASMSPDRRSRAEEDMRARLVETCMWRKAERVLLFNSTSREVATRPLIEAAFSAGKALYLPRVEGGAMEFFRVMPSDELKAGYYGIMEPVSREPFTDGLPPERTLCVVPALACDREGCRLGFGGGYYDRYLAAHPLRTVCLIYEDCVVERLPREGHDIPLDAVITQRGFVYGRDCQ